jgi:uncharacterized membrane protein
MDKILATLQTTLQRWDLHPVVDHFTIGLLIVGVLIDLIASVAPTRTWLRYMALTLMILGAIAAGASYFTGDMEADRIFKAMSEPAKQIFGRHAKLGTYMAVVFGVLAVWRILIQGVTFFAGSRSIYLIFAVISAGVLFYIGSLGGQMVYTYGVGTALMSSPATPVATPLSTPIANESLPTVSVPAATPTTPAPASPVAVPPTPAAPVPTATATATGPSAY